MGASTGANLPHYPEGVREIIAVEPEPYLRARAATAATSTIAPVRVVDAVADQLPFDDGSFDVAVSSLVLCSVADQPAVLAEPPMPARLAYGSACPRSDAAALAGAHRGDSGRASRKTSAASDPLVDDAR